MYHELSRRMRDERGVALITAVMISAIVMVMGATAVTVAVHNSDASARDRRRVESIGSAEAGLDYYFSHLQDVSPAEIECTISKALTGSPTAVFVVRADYFDKSGDPITCPMADNVVPDSALITSRGTTSQVDPTRTMQSFVYLIPKPPKPFGDSAIFSDGSPGIDSNVSVIAGAEVNADIYTNGSIVLDSNVVVNGSVYAQGTVTVNSNTEVKRHIWANGSVTMNGNAIVRSNVTSSTSSVAVNNTSHVYGDAQAATTITAASGAIDGLRIQNTPSDPPPQRPFPPYTYTAQSWIDAGYSVSTFSSCASAKSFIDGITGGDHAVRITSSCDLQWPANSTATARGNLAIISDGSLTMRSNSQWVNSGSPHTLHMIFGLGGTPPCNIEFQSNTDVGDGLSTLFYTPCQAIFRSNTFSTEGQVFGGNVEFNSNSSLTFKKIPVPGLAPGGFDEDITYIREVITEPDPI